MATTTNFGWETPDDTDLVKDGAAAIRTALGGVDTSFVDLKGGTTGQMLTKASATDLDFTWAAAPSGTNWTLLNAGGTSLSGTTTTISGISNKDQIFILVANASGNTSGSQFSLRINTDTGANYYSAGLGLVSEPSYDAATVFKERYYTGQTSYRLAVGALNQASATSGFISISGCNATGGKMIQSTFGVSNGGANYAEHYMMGGYYLGTSTVSSISITSNATFDGGTIFVYTSA